MRMKDTMSDAILKDREERTLEGGSESFWRLPHCLLQGNGKCMESIGMDLSQMRCVCQLGWADMSSH